jgi:hypothetical protein
MRSTKLLSVALILLWLSLAAHAFAQEGGGYVIERSVIGGGSATGSGGAYETQGTISQPLVHSGSGGAYALTGGYWQSSSSAPSSIALSSGTAAPAAPWTTLLFVLLIPLVFTLFRLSTYASGTVPDLSNNRRQLN